METFFGQTATYLWTQSAQIAVLCVLVGAACFALRKRTSHLRYLLWLLIVAKCLVPSLLTVSLAILPNKPEMPKVVPAAVEPSILERLSEIGPKTCFGMIWLAGLGVFTVVVLAKAARIHHHLKSRRRPVNEALQNEADEILAAAGKTPRLWLVAGTGQPFVWGLVRGSVYLPANFTRSTDRAHRRKILAHELAHVARFDALVNVLQTIAQAIFWFHPLVWIANRCIRAEREKCCDETAIARLAASPRDYSTAIVDTLVNEYKSTLPTPSLAIAGPIKNIEDRIKTIMKPGKKFYKRPTVIAIATICFLAAVVVPTTIALTERTEKVDETSSESDVEGKKKKTTFSVYGNVTDHNGAAANGAQIAIITSKLGTTLTDGKLVPLRHIHAENAKIITTDSNGQFYLPDMPDEKFTLVAAHDKGFAQIKSDDLPIPASIRLKPWGRIEGKLAANREAGEGKIGLWRFPNITWHEHKLVCDYESRCDDGGDFVFDKVPAGWFEAGYLICTNKGNSPTFSFTSRTPVEVTAGQTAKLTLGNEGLPVIGKFVPPKGYRKKIPFVAGLRALVTARPKVPYPDNYTQMSKEQQNRWHKNWLKSPDSKAYRSKSWFNNNWRHYTFIINDDGTFRIEDVITGKYDLTVFIEKEIFNSGQGPQDIAYFADVIEVPQIPGRRSDVPLDLGTLELKLPDTKSTGEVDAGGVWGSALDGVQCRVRAEKPTWPQGTVPKLVADLRNRGKRNLQIALEHESWEIEIDGKWHETHTSRSGLRHYLPLGPGEQQQDLKVWIHANDSISQNLRALEPGKHTLRVARLINYDTRPREDMLRVVSNPVEIEIVAAKDVEAVVTRSGSDSAEDIKQVVIEMKLFSVEAGSDFLERRLGVESVGKFLILNEEQRQKLEDPKLSPPVKRWIAAPKVLVLDAETAKITTRQIPDDSDAETGTLKFDVEITPHVSSKGTIRLELDISMKTLDGHDDSGNPIISAKRIVTTVMVDEGKSTLLELAGKGGPKGSLNDDEKIFAIITPAVLEPPPEAEAPAAIAAIGMSGLRRGPTPPLDEEDIDDEAVERGKLALKMRGLALAWYMYAEENNNITAGSLADLRPYIKDWSWVEANAALAAEKQNFIEIRNPARYPVAYDKSLLKRNDGTTVAFADGHVEYCKIDRLDRLGLVPDVVKRVKSMHKLKNAGLMLFVYANDNDDKLPAALDELEPYDESDLLDWMKDNVDYFGEGTDLTNVKDAGKLAIAYDKNLLQAQGGTAVLFADGHVEFIKRENVETIFEIEARFLFVDKDFLEEVWMGHESVSGNIRFLSKMESQLKTEAIASSGPVDKPTRVNIPVKVKVAFVDDSQVSFHIKVAQMRGGSSMLTAPKIMVLDAEEAEIKMVREIPFIAGYKEGHTVTTAGEPVRIVDYVETGTTLSVTPRITEDGKYCVLNLETKLSELSGYDRRRYRNKFSYDIPRMEVFELKCTGLYIPVGKTLLLFAPWNSADDKKGLIILIKPVISEAKGNIPTVLPPIGNPGFGGFGGGFRQDNPADSGSSGL